MTDALFAFFAAVAAAVGTLALAQTARAIGVRRAASLTGAVGMIIGPTVAIVAEGVPMLSTRAVGWAFAAGGLSLIGNGLFLASTRRLEIALVAPIVASAGAVAALVASLVGTPPGALTLTAGVVLSLGVLMTARGTASRDSVSVRRPVVGVQMAVASAVTLGLSYLALGRADDVVGGAWAYVALMLLMFVVWTVPTALSRGGVGVAVRWWLVIVVAELSGAIVFVLLGRAAAGSPVVASLIYSQYAAIAMLVAILVWRERPSPTGVTGAVLALSGTVGILFGVGAA